MGEMRRKRPAHARTPSGTATSPLVPTVYPRSVRAGKKGLIATMRGGGEGGQEKHGDRISASGSVGAEGKGGAREEQTLVKTDTKHKNKTLDTQTYIYIYIYTNLGGKPRADML